LNLKKWLFVALLISLFIFGFYLIFTSGRIEIDLYSTVLFLLVAAVILYMYILSQRNKD
jgi:CHASE2 domain-containing sensor protein